MHVYLFSNFSRSNGLCIVANSLLAYASVNHLHYHILYVREPVLAAKVVSLFLYHCCLITIATCCMAYM